MCRGTGEKLDHRHIVAEAERRRLQQHKNSVAEHSTQAPRSGHVGSGHLSASRDAVVGAELREVAEEQREEVKKAARKVEEEKEEEEEVMHPGLVQKLTLAVKTKLYEWLKTGIEPL